LRKNYRILSELNVEGKSKPLAKPKQRFWFWFFTNILKTKTGNTYYFSTTRATWF
jgi:hypothetical protein